MSSSDGAKLRAWWWHRQGLDGSLQGATPARVLEQTGWARSVAGANPYLTLFARAGTARARADAAVESLDIHELPSARACTYVLPSSHYALALKAGQAFGAAEMRTAAKIGVTESEIEKLCGAVLRALEKGPLDPDGLRNATGSAVRNLGAEGVRKGLTTTLPVALGRLQLQGQIRRISLNGRLDHQRYRYALWHPSPFEGSTLTVEEAQQQMARLYFTWIGPATLSEFQWFSGLGVKAAKAAAEPLKLVPVGQGSDRLLLHELRDQFESFRTPPEPRYSLVSSLDGISQLRRDVRGLLAEDDLARPVFVEKGLEELGQLRDLPSHAILDRGRIVGLWEFDTTSNRIVWSSFVPVSDALRKEVARTEEFVRVDLGDARSFSLDSPKSRTPRVEALRSAAGTA